MSAGLPAFPIPHTVQVAPWLAGDDGSVWGPGGDHGPEVDVPVYGWAPASTDEPDTEGRHEVTLDLDLYVPPGTRISPQDRVRVAGDLFEVEGHLQSFDTGPFGWMPGGRVRLRRVEG